MKCANCGNQIKQKSQQYCPECGKDISEQYQTRRKKRRKLILLTGIPVILVATTLITFFIVGKMKFDPQHLIDRFSETVENEDTSTLATILTPKKASFSIDEKNAGVFLDYLSNHDSDFQAVIEGMEEQAASLKKDKGKSNDSYATVQIKKDGKRWLFFDDYKLVVTPAYIDIVSDSYGTDIYINDEKVATTPEDDALEERFGPFMPGTYKVAGKLDNPYINTEQAEEITLFDMDEDSEEQNIHLNVGKVHVVSSFEDDATIYLNGKKTDIKINGGNQNIGPFPLDEPIRAQLKKEMPWGEIESDEFTYYDGDLELDFNHVPTITDEEREKIFQIINDTFTTYTKALNESDASLLKDNVTEKFQKALKDKVKEVKKEKPDYEGKLIEAQYREDWVRDPEYDKDREAYMVVISVMLTYHEPKGNLGWTFQDKDKNNYRRATDVTMLYDEKANEWKVDKRIKEHFFVYDDNPKYKLD